MFLSPPFLFSGFFFFLFFWFLIRWVPGGLRGRGDSAAWLPLPAVSAWLQTDAAAGTSLQEKAGKNWQGVEMSGKQIRNSASIYRLAVEKLPL